MDLNIQNLPNIGRNASYSISNKGIIIRLVFQCKPCFPYKSFKNKNRYYYAKSILVPYQSNMVQAIWDGYYLLKASMLREINKYKISQLTSKEIMLNTFIRSNRESQLKLDF